MRSPLITEPFEGSAPQTKAPIRCTELERAVQPGTRLSLWVSYLTLPLPVAKETQQGNAEYSLSPQDKCHKRPIPYNWHLLHHLPATSVGWHRHLAQPYQRWRFLVIPSYIPCSSRSRDLWLLHGFQQKTLPTSYLLPLKLFSLSILSVSNYVKSVKLRGQDIKIS